MFALYRFSIDYRFWSASFFGSKCATSYATFLNSVVVIKNQHNVHQQIKLLLLILLQLLYCCFFYPSAQKDISIIHKTTSFQTYFGVQVVNIAFTLHFCHHRHVSQACNQAKKLQQSTFSKSAVTSY